MGGGYTGKILFINLDDHSSSVEKTDLDAAEKFIGSKGLGAKLLFDKLPVAGPLIYYRLYNLLSGQILCSGKDVDYP